MFFFKKKKKEEEQAHEDAQEDDPDALPEVPVAAPRKTEEPIGDASIAKMAADVEKLKAQFTTFYELQKTSAERFSRINEQVGELRSMIIEREKAAQLLEAKTIQAIDLVKTVQPEKLMIELRKGENKIEALKASVESTENIINNVINELKEVKNKVNVFRGMEQVLSLNEEAKKELLDVRKVQAVVERHADKVETVFSEMQKKFADFARFGDTVKDLDKSFKQISSDFDSIKIKIADFSSKKEAENMITRLEDFEKHTSNVVRLMNSKFDRLEKELNAKFRHKFEDAEKLMKGFEALSLKTPNFDKYLGLLSEEAKKIPAKDSANAERLREIGDETPMPLKEEASNGSLLGKVTGAFRLGKK